MTLRKKIGNLRSYYKQIYFRWKHGLISKDRDYSQFTEEELVERFFKGNEGRFRAMQLWESTDEYADLLLTLLKEHIHQDILEVYDGVLKKAKTGEEKAVKTLLLLQKEVKSLLKEKAQVQVQVEEEDDDLII